MALTIALPAVEDSSYARPKNFIDTAGTKKYMIRNTITDRKKTPRSPPKKLFPLPMVFILA